ncbi:hypothetical protein IQ22_00040 [Pseudomonas duriflava]|uniref:Uncharacterized protein n=1 Tax=Pseudomonas duriflava TaxID=459528 RepID=A0A562QQI7_9PSED|nr:hypothetical protein IQ22_00040 [Pseudomonas duriflava]
MDGKNLTPPIEPNPVMPLKGSVWEKVSMSDDQKVPANENIEHEDLDNREVDEDQLDEAVEETFPASDPISP